MNLITSIELTKELKISKSKLSRWIQAGLSYYQDPDHSQRLLFDLDEVKEFVGKLETGRKLKTYRIYDNSGGLKDTVIGSKKAVEVLSKLGSNPLFRSYAIDDTGKFFIYVQSRLRLYNPEKHGGVGRMQRIGFIILAVLLIVSSVFSECPTIFILTLSNGNCLELQAYTIDLIEDRFHGQTAGSGLKFTLPLNWIESISCNDDKEKGLQKTEKVLFFNENTYRKEREIKENDGGINAAFIPSSFKSSSNINSDTNPNLVDVSGYYRKDGTYVAPYQRTQPNNTKTDNLSYRK